ncbi:NifU-like domain containing protein [Trichomonas vaginalis G3]|uniref:NifU-like domain containing protein n=1 Tax=Trichomonas vaginalis (strain ATCC PRA-98 / G3) TaxID=412133 RepID=A2FGS9_TRIV3|nr:NFU1 iron-sulfur cluster scaffold [Trichomonas vaginalis G3]EAX95873.1 NifU-like domain containing protein [Trichomonas vaginalis G3]KAI5528800.1 NFU1 iron-sulfur cluster scaffold [Trichomonas vaginalis G3]|eukprot:XP_001308803.1 NifU-like domain containing protein [Trichomonas vaginalis G3]
MLSSIGTRTSGFGNLFFRSFAKAAEKPKVDGDELFKRVNKIIEEKVRPFIRSEGGDIELVDIKNGCMIVSLEGACTHCGSKNNTLYNGVLGAVQDEIPEIENIRQKMPFDDFDI